MKYMYSVFSIPLFLFSGFCFFFTLISIFFHSAHWGTALMILSGLFALFALFFSKKIGTLSHHPWVGNILFLLAVALLCFCIFFFSLLLLRGQKRLPPNPEESTVIVLGSRVNGGEPSLILQNRLDVAADYLLKNPTAHCIVSGGQGLGEDSSEAAVMKDYLTKRWDINPDRIFLEDRSLNTYENLSFSKKIVEENFLSPTVVIATDHFHEMRAGILATKLGFSPPYCLPSQTPWGLLPSLWFREILSVTYMMVRY